LKTHKGIAKSICSLIRQPKFSFYVAGMSFAFTLAAIARACSLFEKQRQSCLVDYLTGISNTQGFHEIVKREASRCRRRGTPLTVGFMDCDNFKELNDTMGHHAGDEILRTVAATAQECLRGEDTVARLGGDEFVFVLPETGETEARHVLQRLHNHLNRAMQQNGSNVTFSLGAITVHHPQESVEQLIHLADRTMYHVKCNGKNSIRIDVMPASAAA
jgi:diguanylate cyclase (GGDEF)-like protein